MDAHEPPCCHWQEHAQRFFDEHPPEDSTSYSLRRYVDDLTATWQQEQESADPDLTRILAEFHDAMVAQSDPLAAA